MNDWVRKLAANDGRFSPEAVRFLLESLEHAVRLAGKNEAEGADRHVSGQQLLAGMRAHAAEIFGPLAPSVWRSWGIRDSMDWGRVVFMLVEAGHLKRQDNDSIEDFRGGFDFDEAFEKDYRPQLPPTVESQRGASNDE